MTEILIAAAPLLLLLGLLLLGHYPGCEILVRLSERLSDSNLRQEGARPAPGPSRPGIHTARGGLLLALSLSGRAPPAPPST